MMIFVNRLVGLERVPREAVLGLLKILSPFAPHLSEELFSQLGASCRRPGEEKVALCLAQAEWPSWDEALCVDHVVVMPIQVNGKVRSRVEIAREANEEQARAAALADSTIIKLLEGKQLKKFIFVPGRILNLIIQ